MLHGPRGLSGTEQPEEHSQHTLKSTVENVICFIGRSSQKYQKNVSAPGQVAGAAVISWTFFWDLQRTKAQCCVDVIGRWMPEQGCWKAQIRLSPKSSWNPKYQRIWASKASNQDRPVAAYLQILYFEWFCSIWLQIRFYPKYVPSWYAQHCE